MGADDGSPHLELLKVLSGMAERELVVAPMVIESVDVAKGLGDIDVEDEVDKGQEADGNPVVAVPEPRKQDLGCEDEGQEVEEELE